MTESRSQAGCGACTSFAMTAVFATNNCMKGGPDGTQKSAVSPPLSPQEIVSCASGCQGCKGCWPDNAFNYFKGHGLVKDSCITYKRQETECPKTCDKPATPITPAMKTKCTHFQRFTTRTEMKLAIKHFGAVLAILQVYHDIYCYKDTYGIYESKGGKEGELHAVKLIGWGSDSVGSRDVKYWWVQNSWGSSWGED